MDFITLIILIMVLLLCGLIAVLFIFRKYLTSSNNQLSFQNQADLRLSTKNITDDQTFDGELGGEFFSISCV